MLSAVLLALSLAAVSADYIQTSQFGAADCAGTPSARAGRYLGCQQTGSAWRAVTCSNSSFGVFSFYNTSDCTGAVLQTNPILDSFSCANSGGTPASSQISTCQSGVWAAPTSSLAVVNYPTSPACPTNTSADNAVSYSVGSCLSFGSASARASCTSSSYSLTVFPSADCSGAGTPATGSIGCAPASGGQPGVSVYQCTSGASSASIAFASIALMLVAAASASAL